MKRILFVDDDPVFLELVTPELEAAGYFVQTLEDPTQAESIFRHFKPDLVITDERMPQLTGHELVESLRRIHANQRFLIVTGYNMENVPPGVEVILKTSPLRECFASILASVVRQLGYEEPRIRRHGHFAAFIGRTLAGVARLGG